MALQLSTTARNALLDQIETTVGTSPKFQFFSGSPPATCATADSGTKLTDDALPSDWLANASAGSKAKLGSWVANGIAGAGAGTAAGYWRIKDSTGTTCHLQGTVTATGGGGDVTLDNTSIANAQVVTFASFTLNALNS
jgi:hypothetical protein